MIAKFYTQKTRLLLPAGALFFALLAAPATAGFAQSSNINTSQMMGRLDQIENQIQTLSRAVYRGEKVPMPADAGVSSAGSAAISNFEVRLSGIEAQQRTLTGQLEQIMFDVKQIKDRMDKTTADNELRFRQIEGGASASASTSTSTTGTAELRNDAQMGDKPLPSGMLGTLSETGASAGDAAGVLYEEGFADIRAAKYEDAAVKFKKFMNAYPSHTLAGNAQYWLAETYYVRGDYQQSAKMFAQGYQDYPQGAKAADSLLKLGLSLGKLDRKEDACLSLQQLKKQFPGDQSAVVSRANQEIKQLGCK